MKLKGCFIMKKLSFKTLHENYNVIIPMLQRDYAYGRENEKEKRESFLKNLKFYLDDTVPHELDFIYGSTEADKYVKLLDGQQRITTLFILHWYLSLTKDYNGQHHFDDFRKLLQLPNGESKFSYKTRYSSSDFCNMLVMMQFQDIDYADKYSDIIHNKKATLSEFIRQEKWFLPHWNYDPTISGMLNMLDSIKKIFVADECEGYFEKITNGDQIVFNFLNLDDFKLTDELYIKMNSRGRSLTRFENLKSKLLQLYSEAGEVIPDACQKKLSEIESTTGKKGVYKTLRDYVAFMLDTQWTDLFWNEWLNTSNREEKPNVDDMMLCFISVLAINEYILLNLGENLTLSRHDPFAKEVNELMSQKDKDAGITIRYDKFVELFRKNKYAFLFKLIDYFNIFNENGKLKSYYSETFEKELFSYIVNDYKSDKMEYEPKAKIFAYTQYLLRYPNPDPDKLKAWMHFVCNVCSNSYTLPNATYTFGTALAWLNYLCCEDVAIELQTRNLDGIAVLDKLQIEEEILKMQLSRNPAWEAVLTEAENKLSYFEGRLRYPLIECCGIGEHSINDDYVRERFCNYVEKIAAIFPDKSGCRCEVGLIRAILSKGDYLMYFNSSNTFLKNADRDNSWRRYLKEKPSENTTYHPHMEVVDDIRNYFKEVIDDRFFDANNVEASLETIAQNRGDDIPMWRKLIIDYPKVLNGTDVMSFGVDRFIRWNVEKKEHNMKTQDNYEIDLLQRKTIFGYHAELFSLCKYYDLQGKTFGRIGEAKYKATKASQDTPCFYFGLEDSPLLSVIYQDDGCFRFVFEDGSEKNHISYEDVESELKSL